MKDSPITNDRSTNEQPTPVQPVFELADLYFSYEENTGLALERINMTIAKGEWVWIVGPSRSGKSTLCGLLSGVLQSRPGGSLEGTIHFNEQDMAEYQASDLAGQVGIVFQDPEAGLIHEVVEDELAFGPENLCKEPAEIEQRIQSALHIVNMTPVRERRMNELSGGQMQRINIASVLTMEPHILILDDALESLDAPAIEQMMTTLRKLHSEGYTIIMTTSRMDLIQSKERVIALEEGQIVAEGLRDELEAQHQSTLKRLGLVPNNLNLQSKLHRLGLISEQQYKEGVLFSQHVTKESHAPLLEVQNLHFAYPTLKGKASRPVLSNLNLTLHAGDTLALRGPNGSGKTTFGKIVAGLLPIQEGVMKLDGQDVMHMKESERSQRVGYVFQNPEHMFVTDSVIEECILGLKDKGDNVIKRGEYWLDKLGLLAYRDSHPHHLSVADQQLLSLACVLILQPRLLILDEPTAGLGYGGTDLLMGHCRQYVSENDAAAIVITHDRYTTQHWTTNELNL